MAIFTLLCGAVILFAGTGYILTALQSDNPDKIRESIKQTEDNKRRFSEIRDRYVALHQKLLEAQLEMLDSKAEFYNGGHVLGGKPLADEEFKICNADFDEAIGKAKVIVSQLEEQISSFDSDLVKLRARLDEVMKKLSESKFTETVDNIEKAIGLR